MTGETCLFKKLQKLEVTRKEERGSQLRSCGLFLTSHGWLRPCSHIRTQGWSQVENKAFDCWAYEQTEAVTK